MKLDKLVGERFKEKPSDCVIESHALMMRGGYMERCCQRNLFPVHPIKADLPENRRYHPGGNGCH